MNASAYLDVVTSFNAGKGMDTGVGIFSGVACTNDRVGGSSVTADSGSDSGSSVYGPSALHSRLRSIKRSTGV